MSQGIERFIAILTIILNKRKVEVEVESEIGRRRKPRNREKKGEIEKER